MSFESIHDNHNKEFRTRFRQIAVLFTFRGALSGLALLFFAAAAFVSLRSGFQLSVHLKSVFEVSPKTGVFSAVPWVLAFFTAVSFFAIRWNLTRKTELVTQWTIMIVGAIAGLLLLTSSDFILQGDFAAYVETARGIRDGQVELNLLNIYHQRAVVFYLLILSVFPDTLISLQLAALVVTLVSALLLKTIVRQYFGPGPALLSLALVLATPTTLLAVGPVSHNVPGNFFLLLTLFLLMRLDYVIESNARWPKILFFAFIVGLTLLLAELQRTLGITLTASVLFVALTRHNPGFEARNRRFLLRRFSGYGFVLLIFLASLLLLKAKFGTAPTQMNLASMLYSFNDHEHSGEYDSGVENRSFYFSTVPPENQLIHATEKYSGMATAFPFEWAKMNIRKGLYMLGFNSYFYTGMDESPHARNRSLIVEHPMHLQGHTGNLLLFASTLALPVLLGRFQSGKTNAFIVFPLVFAALIIFSEVNPQYSLILVPHLCAFTGVGLCTIRSLVRKRFASPDKESIELASSYSGFHPVSLVAAAGGGAFAWIAIIFAAIFLVSKLLPGHILIPKESISKINLPHLKGNQFEARSDNVEISLTNNSTPLQFDFELEIDHPASTLQFLMRSTVPPDQVTITAMSQRVFPTKIIVREVEDEIFYYAHFQCILIDDPVNLHVGVEVDTSEIEVNHVDFRFRDFMWSATRSQ